MKINGVDIETEEVFGLGPVPTYCKSCGNYLICRDYYFSSYQPDEHGKCVGWHSKKDHKEDCSES